MKPHRLLSLLLLPALLPLFTSCTDTLLETPAAGSANADIPEGYYFILDTDVPQNAPQTRVAYADINHSYFEEDDRLGIYVIDSEGNRITDAPANAQYKVTNVTNITTGTVRQVLENVGTDVPRGENYRYVIYYPYDPDMTFDRLKDLTHSVQTNQHADPASTTSLTPYEQSDLLWDVVSEKRTSNDTPYVEIRMDHAMANIILNIDEKYVQAGSEEGYEVYIVNSPATASGINLTQGLETAGWGYNVPTSDPNDPIRMWYTGYGTSGELQFRAVIPACQTISNAVPFFSISAPDGTKGYKLNASLELKPGKNYIFNIRESGGSIIPEVTDDDSWVLDVLDPETGEPVGLLCREYLHYQPQQTTIEADEITGTKVLNDTKLAINSQAWVFYNLQPDGRTPELSKGTVLQFIYDIHINRGNGNTGTGGAITQADHWWPLPHTQPINETHAGLFTPEHGFKWIKNPTPASNGNYYGISSSELTAEEDRQETQYYMHGGTITWNGTENKISDFTPTNLKITNEIAKKQGHVAINPNTREISVSYSAISDNSPYIDADNNRVGILIPRNLIDTRLNENNELETNLYPLVKIGYNQFWISKAFQVKTLTDGTPLTCYNKKGNPDSSNIDERKPAAATFNDDDGAIGMGYIYPFAQKVKIINKPDTNYDPYNDPAEMAGPQGNEWDNRPSTYKPAPLYNKPAIENSQFPPIAPADQYEYIVPTMAELKSMTNYFGFAYAAKLCSREIARSIGNDKNAYPSDQDRYTALMRGEMYLGDFFAANISGFNLRAMGFYSHQKKDGASLGTNATLILKSEPTVSPNSVAYISFSSYDVWSSDSKPDFMVDEGFTYSGFWNQYFAQVRLLMRFKNPTSNNISLSTQTRSASSEDTEGKSINHNIYIPIQPAD